MHLYYLGSIIVFILLGFLFLVWRSASNNNRKLDKARKEFLKREEDANSVRRADISSLPYLQIPLDRLPLDAAREIGEQTSADKLKALSQKKILNLSMYTNTDLKMMYGPANLDELTECDNNFTSLITLLNKLAGFMCDAGKTDAAKSCLEYAVSIGSDITATYVRLGELYAAERKTALLDGLIQKAEGLTSLSAPTIITKLNSIKSGLK